MMDASEEIRARRIAEYEQIVKNTLEAAGISISIDPFEIDNERWKKILLVFNRLKVVDSLYSDEIFTPINRISGPYQDTALRIYLMLTCIEVLGSILSYEKYYEYNSWIEANKGDIKQRREQILLESIRTRGEVFNVSTMTIALREIWSKYNEQYGFKANFKKFFKKMLDEEIKKAIADKFWVYKDKKPIGTSLNLVGRGYSSGGIAGLSSLEAARKRWDALADEDKLMEVCGICELIRNGYTHGLIPRYITTDKPFPGHEWAKTASEAIRNNRVEYLSDSSFSRLEKEAQNNDGISMSMSNGKLCIKSSSVKDASASIELVL